MTKKSTAEEFIKKSNEIHKNRYDYSLVEYINNCTKVQIICSIHGIFEQTLSGHLSNNGCFKCFGTPKSTTEEFVKKANIIHDNKYDYSSVEYENIGIKVKIICNEHGIFEQLPNNHLKGQGCPECGILFHTKNQTSTTEKFKERAKEKHGDLYDYSQVEYKGSGIQVKIICKIHGEFLQTPTNHLRTKFGCQECSGNVKLIKEEFLEKAKEIHGTKFNYSLVEYENYQTKVKIICPKHGIFEQTPNNHLSGRDCLKCVLGQSSKQEVQWLDYLGIPEKYRNKTIYIKDQPFKVDAFIPYFGEPTIYEYSGNYWHGNPERFNLNDINQHNKKTFGQLYQETIDRLKLFRENGYKVVYIWENEFKNLLKFNKQFNVTIKE